MNTTPTERRLAVTPGRAIATGYGAYVNGRAASSIECEQVDGTRPTVAYVMDEFDGGEGFANARLYTDAHNTYNACDMLPSELLVKLTKCAWELEKARQELVSCKHYVPPGIATEIVDDRITRIELFISTLNLHKP